MRFKTSDLVGGSIYISPMKSQKREEGVYRYIPAINPGQLNNRVDIEQNHVWRNKKSYP